MSKFISYLASLGPIAELSLQHLFLSVAVYQLTMIRQFFGFLLCAPVSYTHLDVYKRQLYGSVSTQNNKCYQ